MEELPGKVSLRGMVHGLHNPVQNMELVGVNCGVDEFKTANELGIVFRILYSLQARKLKVRGMMI